MSFLREVIQELSHYFSKDFELSGSFSVGAVGLEDEVAHELRAHWMHDWHELISASTFWVSGQHLCLNVDFIQTVIPSDDLIELLRLLASKEIFVVLDDQFVEDLCLLVVHDSLIVPVSRLELGPRDCGLVQQEANYLVFLTLGDLEAE